MYDELKQAVETVFNKRRIKTMQVNIETKNKEAVAFVEGSINSANATEFGAALAALPGEADSITLDIAGLDYISSAGLRVLLSLKKGAKKSLSV